MNELVKPTIARNLTVTEMREDAQMGGKMSLRDMSIPYLAILQGMSPQVQPASDKYIKGSVASMIYLSVAEEIFPGDTGVPIVPCYFERVVNEWTPKEKGGGLVATHNAEGGILSKATRDPQSPGKLWLPNGNLAVETMNNYLLIQTSHGWTQAIYPMKSTAIKHCRNWNSTLFTMKVPGTREQAARWYYVWNLLTRPERKEDKVWYSPAFKQGEPVDDETYAMAKEFASIASTGMLRRPLEEERVSDEDSPI